MKKNKSKLIMILFLIISDSLLSEKIYEVTKETRIMTISKNETILDSTKIKYLKNTYKYVFPVGKNIDDFGYHYYPETGEILSVECIRIINNSIYLIDQAHKNIKKINLDDGEMSVSNSLKRDRTYLTSIGYLNNSLYIFTDFNIVFNLDLALNLKHITFLKDYNGLVYVYSEDENELTFYSVYASMASNDAEKTHYMKINKDGQCTSYFIEKKPFELSQFYQTPQGYAGYEISLENKLFFQTSNLTYEVPESFKNLNNHSCIDVDYSDRYVVCFKANDKKVEISVYEY